MEPIQESSLSDMSKLVRQQRDLFYAHIQPLRHDLWRYCHNLTGSIWEAEDLVQETLLRAFSRLAITWQPINPRAFIFRIASRAYLDSKRNTQPHLGLDIDELSDAQPESLSELGFEAIERLVRTLTPLQRTVVLLTQVFEFTAAETANLLDTSEGSITAALARARKNLHKSPSEKVNVGSGDLTIQRFADAFNAKDIQAIIDLLDESVTVEIIGVVEERGRDKTMESAMKHTLADEDANFATLTVLDGRETLLLLKDLPDGGRALSEVIFVTTEDGRVSRLTSYYFLPEFLSAAAMELGIPVVLHDC